MAGLIKRGKTYHAVYYVGGKERRRSLETTSYQVAKERLRNLETSHGYFSPRCNKLLFILGVRKYRRPVARPVPWTQVCGKFFCVF